jgi:hypothetical protein
MGVYPYGTSGICPHTESPHDEAVHAVEEFTEDIEELEVEVFAGGRVDASVNAGGVGWDYNESWTTNGDGISHEKFTGVEVAVGTPGIGASIGPVIGIKTKKEDPETLVSIGGSIKVFAGIEADLTFDPTGGYWEFFVGIGTGAEAEFFIDPASFEVPPNTLKKLWEHYNADGNS